MTVYIVKRLFQSIPTLFGVTVVSYFLIFGIGDPCRVAAGLHASTQNVETCREQRGFNDPWYQQLARFYRDLLRGDLGRSFQNNRPVLERIAQRFPESAKLAVSAFLLALPLGVGLGAWSAARRNTAVDYTGLTGTLLGVSAPTFFLCLLVQAFVAYPLARQGIPWAQVSGWAPGWQGLKYLIFPTLVLATGPIALLTRLTRSAMLDVLSKDYVRTARAKGLAERVVIYKHALRNALIPVVTVLVATLAALMEGSFVVEYQFNWPGIGLMAVQAVSSLDAPVIQGTVLLSATLFVLSMILLDILYALIDPKIRYD